MMRAVAALAVTTAFGFLTAPAVAVTPPNLVNYQGVLRDASGNPLSGSHNMVFRFYDAPTAGQQLLIDEHLASGTGAVTVSGGLFSVALGSGTVVDGTGPGTYTSLGDVFRRLSAVYLEVQVGIETLNPRIRIVSSAYALAGASADPPCFDATNRFVDCGNGTVTDTVTGLVWLKNANCTALYGSSQNYVGANTLTANLADGQCGLTDKSVAGDWRLPTKAEWDALFAQAAANACASPKIPDRLGTGCCGTAPCAFTGIANDIAYWSGTTVPSSPSFGYLADQFAGTTPTLFKLAGEHVWPVRARKE
jgi:hypothetical protein